ncbi:hypothetical protein HDU67_008913 [Dinochytrium kinnereticum]|nr:hypothetical protein HDU67_008913 [Dinochytrium kinnereticum]
MKKERESSPKKSVEIKKERESSPEPEEFEQHFSNSLKAAAEEAGPETRVAPLEYGRIFFLYRPKVNREHASSIDEVQHFFMLLCPVGKDWHPRKENCRLIVIGKKKLPEIDPTTGQHESAKSLRFWGQIESVGDVDNLEKALGRKSYSTATRELPDHLNKIFGSRHFVSVDPTELLDYAGVEILLIAAHDNVVEDLSEQGKGESKGATRICSNGYLVLEKVGEEDVKTIINPQESPLRELHLAKANFKTEALLGDWT